MGRFWIGIVVRAFLGAVSAIAVGLAALPGAAAAEERVALVIGNAAYAEAPRLATTADDAGRMAEALEELAFDVTRLTDLDRMDMARALRDLTERIAASGDDVMVLVYFAGYAAAADGASYLLPVDAAPGAPLAFEAMELDTVLAATAGAARRIVVVDASRSSPFVGGDHAAIGPAPAHPPDGTVIAVAAKPGNAALDGPGPNSLYAAALAAAISTPNLTIEEIFARTADDVSAVTGGLQEPWFESSLSSEVYLRRSFQMVITEPPIGGPGPEAPPDVGESVWGLIGGTEDSGLVERFIERFPDSASSAIARERLAELSSAAAAPSAPAMPPTLASCLAGDNQASIDFPVPSPSDKVAISREKVLDGLGDAPSLLDLGEVLGRTLDDAGYVTRRYYALRADGDDVVGFALLSRLERIRADGTPFPPDERFVGPEEEGPFDLIAFVSQLFVAPVGYYRMIMFTVSSKLVDTSAPPPTHQEAEALLQRGNTRLSRCFDGVAFDDSFDIDALVYEFEHRPEAASGEPVAYLQPGRLPAMVHLRAAHLLANGAERP